MSLSRQTAAELRHTLRTPINHISGYSEILLEDLALLPDSAEAAGLLTAIREDARRNLDAIQTVLSTDTDYLAEDAPAELRRQMANPLDRMSRAGEALEKLLPAPMLPDLARIRSATSQLAAEMESPATIPAPIAPATRPVELDQGAADILVVDDDETNRDMLYRLLTRHGITAKTSENGQLALAMMRQQRFDLVLLDLVMPGLNGLQVIEIIKADPKLRQTPVILISALDDMDTVARCIELGAEDYLFKPVNPVLLRARVRSTLERRRAEDAIRRKQELESIGALAAGVAHDFNNLLTGVLGNACLLRDTFALSDPKRVLAEEIIKSGERAADLTRQLLSYSGKGSYRFDPIDISRLVTDFMPTIRSVLPANVELRFQLAAVPLAPCDSGQLRQMILNLITNASEAVGAEHGTVVVATGTDQISGEEPGSTPLMGRLAPGRYVYLEVRDTGHGMESSDVARIFDPFYTTKFFGRGLGLAAVAGIVRMHNGGMRVFTAPKKGSTFRVLLPPGTEPDRADGHPLS